MNKDNLDFNFGTTGSIFGDFTPDLSSIQKQPEEVEEDEEVETIDQNKTEDQDSDNDSMTTDDDTDDQIEEESEDEPNTDSEEVEDYSNVSYKAITDYLAESGIIDGLEDYDGEDSPEALEIAVGNTIKNMVQHYKDSIPEEGKQFLNYLEKGGDPSKFFQSLEKPIDFESIDLTNEDNQKKVYTEYLKSLDYTPEEIQEELNDAEDNLLLEKKANTAIKKLQKIHQNKQANLIAEQEALIQEQEKQYTNYINSIKSTISSSNQIAGLSISPSEKIEFEKYLLQTDDQGLTKYQKELNENPIQTQLELAYLKFKKYNFSKVTKQVKTEETRRIKNLIKNSDKVNSRSPQVTNNKQGDLSAFKSSLFN